MKKNYCLCLLFFPCLFLVQSCSEQKSTAETYYTLDDFATVEKFDVHEHINTYNPYFINFAKQNNFKILSLNVGAPGYPTIPQQQQYTLAHLKNFKNDFAYTTTFDINGFEDSNWQAKTLAYLKASFDSGAIGVKIWKNIGMEYKTKAGKFVMADDPRLDTIFDFIEKSNKTLVGHLGEPKNCWLPLDKMTVKNDREYFKNHPQYHMFLHPEFPSYDDQINARDHLLEKHSNLRFDGAHLGSLEWDVDELAKRLDKFPQMAVDMAARISHLEYQALKDNKKVRDFFIKYQDRLLYATDMEIDENMDTTVAKKEAHDVWTNNWKFFTSDELMSAPELTEKFKGLHLPKDVIDKIYRKNAQKWFPGLPQ